MFQRSHVESRRFDIDVAAASIRVELFEEFFSQPAFVSFRFAAIGRHDTPNS